MANVEDWRKNADTHKMSSGEVRAAGVEASKRPRGHHPGEVLHQTRKLPVNTTSTIVGGVLITAAIGYSVLYSRKKPEATAVDVAKVTAGVADASDTRPRK